MAPVLPAPERSARALQSMLRLRLADHRDGSLRLYSAACRAVEHDLSDYDALVLLREYCRLRPFSKDWTDEEILKRVEDARKKVNPGSAYTPERSADGLIALGGRDPETGRVVLSSTRTLPTAEAYVQENHLSWCGRTLYYYAGQFWEWNGSRYVEIDEDGMGSRLHPWLHQAVRYGRDPETKEMVLLPFDANPATTQSAITTLRNHTYLSPTTPCPGWLGNRSGPAPSELLACRSTLLHLPSGELIDPTPQFFSMSALDYDLDLEAPEPMQWLQFLHQLFDGDVQSLELLQEWFGYCLVADTSQQKMLLVVGPKRSGKGTIARILSRLVGEGGLCAPTTSSLASQFGMQTLVGRKLAIVSDARFSGEGMSTVTERLLAISGEDAISVERKYLEAVTLKLPTRFMFLTNESPKLADSSGALAARFMVLRLTRSFYDAEDPELTPKLMKELPGILNWAIGGWRRLRERGRFVMPESSRDVLQSLEELGSPIATFVRDECVLNDGARVDTDALYRKWNVWCSREGFTKVTERAVFGRDLSAAFASIRRRRGSDNQYFYQGIGLPEDVL